MPDELPEECCAKCRFWEKELGRPADEAFGNSVDAPCRRFPKVFVGDHEDDYVVNGWSHPLMLDFDWCGEFQPRKEAPAAPRMNDAMFLSNDINLSPRALSVLRIAIEHKRRASLSEKYLPTVGMLRSLSWEAVCGTKGCLPSTTEEIAEFCHANGITIPGMPAKDTP